METGQEAQPDDAPVGNELWEVCMGLRSLPELKKKEVIRRGDVAAQ